jgi:hypothetical protein
MLPREHDDWQVRFCSKRSNDFQAVFAPEQQIKNRQVNTAHCKQARHLTTIGGGAHPKALTGQIVGDHRTYCRIIVDDKDVLQFALRRVRILRRPTTRRQLCSAPPVPVCP